LTSTGSRPKLARAGNRHWRNIRVSSDAAPVAWRSVLSLAVVVALATWMFLFRLGAADWENDSEAYGGQVVQEMVGGYGWVLPLTNGRHLLYKPPLFYWLGALSAVVRHTGGDVLDARLPSAVLGTACAVMVYAFAYSLGGASVALWSALILITSSQFFIEARNSRVDIALCCFLTAGLFLAHQVWEGAGGRRSALLAGLCIGLAVLSKGPLALALAVLVLGATAFVAPPAPGWRLLLSLWTLAAALGVPAIWYVAATAQQGWAFLHLHFFSENVDRMLGGQGQYPVWFYIEPFVVGSLPWIAALPGAAADRGALPERSRRFLWVWVIVMLVFFSISPGKRRAYLLPLRPAMSIVLAGWLVPQLERWRHRFRGATPSRAVHVGVAVAVVALLATVEALRLGLGGFGAAQESWSHWWRWYLQTYTGTVVALVAGIGVGTELMLRWLYRGRLEWAAFAFTGTLAWGLTLGASSAAIVRGEGATFRHLAHDIEARVPPTQPLAFFDGDDQLGIALLFYLHRRMPVEPPPADAPCTPPHQGLYLVPESHWDELACFRDASWREILRGGPVARAERAGRRVFACYGEPSSQLPAVCDPARSQPRLPGSSRAALPWDGS
jgi:4-amino-4-deoxy-L-arabinose transferase-like glycosyltransferase